MRDGSRMLLDPRSDTESQAIWTGEYDGQLIDRLTARTWRFAARRYSLHARAIIFGKFNPRVMELFGDSFVGN
jgi:hypothetical protein